MRSLCYRIDYAATEGESPAALGNRIAAAVIAYGRNDGAHERQRYADTEYRPANAPLIVKAGGAAMRDPNRWQPLALDQIVAQNGLPVPGKVQRFIGSHWGRVRAFALPAPARGMAIDPGAPPRLGEPATDREFKRAAVEVIRYSGELDARDGVVVDISPETHGGNTLGTNDGNGHERNPVTGAPYAPNRAFRADFARALAEFWADGPDSETPPGHWNTVANDTSDAPGLELRLGGRGPKLDRLEWDVKLYFALNGAVHDAAVAAWGAKGHYDSARPISMIRYMGGKGQSTDPRRPAYHPDGLPLEPGLVELAGRKVVVRSWLGAPDDPERESRGVGWVPATNWIPYQLPTFVTPAFAGYVSGHSTFSRAAAEVLTEFTGTPYFPGGLLEWTVKKGDLRNEAGPTRDITLQWATYYDAADAAGISRLYGGIHISADDFAGRRLGAQCGKEAWALAQRYFAGTAA
jgi:hypothetical protein